MMCCGRLLRGWVYRIIWCGFLLVIIFTTIHGVGHLFGVTRRVFGQLVGKWHGALGLRHSYPNTSSTVHLQHSQAVPCCRSSDVIQRGSAFTSYEFQLLCVFSWCSCRMQESREKVNKPLRWTLTLSWHHFAYLCASEILVPLRSKLVYIRINSNSIIILPFRLHSAKTLMLQIDEIILRLRRRIGILLRRSNYDSRLKRGEW